MLHILRLNTPLARLRLLIAPAVVATVVVIAWAVQPSSGPTWDVSAWRPFQVSPAVWVPLGVGFCANLVSSWIWALKPKSPATGLFAASGWLTLLFTFAATRSFMAASLPSSLLTGLQATNMLGASGFGMVMICLFLIYPGCLPLWRWSMAANLILFGGWTLIRSVGPWRHFASVQPITFAEMVVIVLLGLWQIAHARDDPKQHAIALWLGACVGLGAGIFIGTVSVPITLGFKPLIMPQYAFASFLLIYAGLAVGLVRYRLFELGGWAFQLIFHVAAALAIVAVDGFLIGGLSLAPGTSLTLSVLAVAFAYLPLRQFLWRRVTLRGDADADIFHSVIETALKSSGEARSQSWEDLLRKLYQPLQLSAAPVPVKVATIEDEGLMMCLPAVADSPSLVLRYPQSGRALFGPRDLERAAQILTLMQHAEESRGAYDRGVSEERARIARDIHDNIGAQLLRALHSGPAERKDAMIRDTLADLRDTINNAQSEPPAPGLILADLRAETADRLSPHGISLAWQADTAPDIGVLPTSHLNAMRALVREAASNTIKHARASHLGVTVAITADRLTLDIADNGCGFNTDAVTLGHGLGNMKSRTQSLGGVFSLNAEGSGTRLHITIPLDSSNAQP